MALALLIGDCRPLSASDLRGRGHREIRVETAKEAWNYLLPSSVGTEKQDAGIAILGVTLSDEERAELMHWIEQETPVLPVLVLNDQNVPHLSVYACYNVSDSKDRALDVVAALLDGVDRNC